MGQWRVEGVLCPPGRDVGGVDTGARGVDLPRHLPGVQRQVESADLGATCVARGEEEGGAVTGTGGQEGGPRAMTGSFTRLHARDVQPWTRHEGHRYEETHAGHSNEHVPASHQPRPELEPCQDPAADQDANHSPTSLRHSSRAARRGGATSEVILKIFWNERSESNETK